MMLIAIVIFVAMIMMTMGRSSVILMMMTMMVMIIMVMKKTCWNPSVQGGQWRSWRGKCSLWTGRGIKCSQPKNANLAKLTQMKNHFILQIHQAMGQLSTALQYHQVRRHYYILWDGVIRTIIGHNKINLKWLNGPQRKNVFALQADLDIATKTGDKAAQIRFQNFFWSSWHWP